MYLRCVVYVSKRLLVELHSKLWLFLFIYYYTIKQRMPLYLVAFLNLTPADIQRQQN